MSDPIFFGLGSGTQSTNTELSLWAHKKGNLCRQTSFSFQSFSLICSSPLPSSNFIHYVLLCIDRIRVLALYFKRVGADSRFRYETETILGFGTVCICKKCILNLYRFSEHFLDHSTNSTSSDIWGMTWRLFPFFFFCPLTIHWMQLLQCGHHTQLYRNMVDTSDLQRLSLRS